MEKLNIIFLFIILIYFVFSIYKNKKNVVLVEKEEEKCKEIKKSGCVCDEEFAVIAAIVAAIMDDVPYRIKGVFLKPTTDEKSSRWKAAGWQENMTRRIFFRKN